MHCTVYARETLLLPLAPFESPRCVCYALCTPHLPRAPNRPYLVVYADLCQTNGQRVISCQFCVERHRHAPDTATFKIWPKSEVGVPARLARWITRERLDLETGDLLGVMLECVRTPASRNACEIRTLKILENLGDRRRAQTELVMARERREEWRCASDYSTREWVRAGCISRC